MTKNYRELYEQQKDKQIADGFKDLKDDISEVKGEVKEFRKEFNGRIKKVERKVFPDVPQTVQQLPPFYRDPQIVKLLIYLALALLVGLIVFAGLKGIALPKGILG